MRAFPEDVVQYSLMPRDKGVVTAHGIRFKTAYYTCKTAVSELWFDKARQDGQWDIEVAYDPRCLDVVYIAGMGGKVSFERCTMTPRSRSLANVSVAEVEQQAQIDGDARADRKEIARMERLDLNAALEKRVENAKKKKGKPTGQSDRSRTKEIRPNRAGEKASRRGEEAFRPGRPVVDPIYPVAEVVPFPRKMISSSEPDYSMPSLDEILGEDDDQ
jgi:hypothetical protein